MRAIPPRMRGRHFHNAIRWLAIQHLFEGRSPAWVASVTFMSARTVSRIWRRWRTTGKVSEKSSHRGRPQKLTRSQQKWLLKLIESEPTLYLDELALRVSLHTSNPIDASSICRYLGRHRMTRKRVSSPELLAILF